MTEGLFYSKRTEAYHLCSVLWSRTAYTNIGDEQYLNGNRPTQTLREQQYCLKQQGSLGPNVTLGWTSRAACRYHLPPSSHCPARCVLSAAGGGLSSAVWWHCDWPSGWEGRERKDMSGVSGKGGPLLPQGKKRRCKLGCCDGCWCKLGSPVPVGNHRVDDGPPLNPVTCWRPACCLLACW